MGFQQAGIKIDRQEDFEELKAALSRSFAPGVAEKFLRQLEKGGTRVRDFDRVLATGALEHVDEVLNKSGKTAKTLYDALTVSDRAQLREFYLFVIEDISPQLRTKFQKLYQYY